MGFFEKLMKEEPSSFEMWLHSDDDKGSFGEYMVKYALGHDNISGYYKLLNNIYLPHKGKTSEIDVLMIHSKGIFVFEIKNYSGWIFGSSDQKNWTQCLANKTKHTFYNPILQNNTHINSLSEFLGIDTDNFKSCIVFGQRCELKKVPQDTVKYLITNRAKMLDRVRTILANKNEVYTHEKVDKFYNLLLPLTQVTSEQKKLHIKNIKKQYTLK